MLEKLIQNRLNTLYEEKKIEQIHSSQHGFRKHLSTETNLLRLALEAKTVKLTASTTNYIVFFDYKSAFDSVPRKQLYKEMKDQGLPNSFT